MEGCQLAQTQKVRGCATKKITFALLVKDNSWGSVVLFRLLGGLFSSVLCVLGQAWFGGHRGEEGEQEEKKVWVQGFGFLHRCAPVQERKLYHVGNIKGVLECQLYIDDLLIAGCVRLVRSFFEHIWTDSLVAKQALDIKCSTFFICTDSDFIPLQCFRNPISCSSRTRS